MRSTNANCETPRLLSSAASVPSNGVWWQCVILSHSKEVQSASWNYISCQCWVLEPPWSMAAIVTWRNDDQGLNNTSVGAQTLVWWLEGPTDRWKICSFVPFFLHCCTGWFLCFLFSSFAPQLACVRSCSIFVACFAALFGLLALFRFWLFICLPVLQDSLHEVLWKTVWKESSEEFLKR